MIKQVTQGRENIPGRGKGTFRGLWLEYPWHGKEASVIGITSQGLLRKKNFSFDLLYSMS